jgi:regulator of sigma E protease
MLAQMGSLLFTVLAFVTVLSMVIFVHEFGHFQVARWCKVAIDTFSIGFGRTILGWRDKQGVLWKIGSLPLGGYVKFQDDADPASAMPVETPRDPQALAEARARGLFHAQPPGVRALVAAAGPFSNFIFAIVVFAGIAMVFGQPGKDMRPARVDDVAANSAAAHAGVRKGDMIVAVDGAPIKLFADLQKRIADSAGVPLALSIRRDGAIVNLTVTPDAVSGPVAEGPDTGVVKTVGRLGVLSSAAPGEVTIIHPGPIEALLFGAKETWVRIASTGYYVANIVTGRASPAQLAGPLGIAQISGQAAQSAVQHGAFLERVANLCTNLIFLAAVISVAVGIVNLLPVPILDGGQILYCLIEAVRRRPLEPKIQEFGFWTGLAAIGLLFLSATWNDLQRLNVLEFLRGMLS